MFWDPAFVASIEARVYQGLHGGRRSSVLLVSTELEKELAYRNGSSLRSNVVSVLDKITGNLLRYLRLMRFYVRHERDVAAWYIEEGTIQPWYIAANTRAHTAAGVVFHQPCDYTVRHFGKDYCTTHNYNFNETAYDFLAHVVVGRADVLAKYPNGTLSEKDFTTKRRDYRIEDGDVVKFVMLNRRNKTVGEPEEPCLGFQDTRPRLLHPIGSDLRICIMGESNSGKTTLFNYLTGSHAAVSPKVFTTRQVMARSTRIPDEQFDWLAKQFPEATLRPPRITFADTPALLEPFEHAPWKNLVSEALTACDIFYLMIPAFHDPSVEQWDAEDSEDSDGNDSYESESSSSRQYEESTKAVFSILTTRDEKVLSKLQRNATYR
ncbi:GTP binding domain containing protein [Aphelenchoides avenae]|nr:GTP binding domain containing protein [Aphelenchus avenae]